MAVPAGRWVFNNSDSPFGEIGTLRKRATDTLFFLFDLGDVNEIVSGETIASAVVSAIPAEDLTFYGQVLTTYSVGMNITGRDQWEAVFRDLHRDDLGRFDHLPDRDTGGDDMNFGQPTTIPILINALKQQLAADAGLSTASVFASLADDSDLLQAPTWGDRFIAIRPGKFPSNAGTAASGGRDLTGFDSSWRIACFARLKTDQEFKSERLLMDSQGPLSMLWAILKGSLSGSGQQGGQMFTPLDSDGNCILREPGRLVGFDLDAKKLLGEGGKTTWWVIPTYWELKFSADLS